MAVPILSGASAPPTGPIILGVAPKPSTAGGPRAGARRGRSIRLGRALHVLEFLPPWTLTDMHGVAAHCCGRCFKKLPDDPFNGRPGKLVPGAPTGARCVFCGGRADPCD